ncbi:MULTISPECIES: helix-turn-helix transcriptional regulator [Microbacterium]|uniref:helix-turn-helix transcriptional regulator n=1 Tax=Microbacterium TaxID=33882 RepID=UPI0027888A00|nr:MULTISPECIES: helix-turn-helix transcriptional regulator [Microbacterium]MDQ1075444.1 transcriptional regulator with XRE-family HTH domain [Microbacterium sp. SORGH_AS_0969]MDQ1115678.1 transcriptional regulator with XRE-family HTH domain [Microbacterium testaceum]
MIDRAALADFLRTRREALQPEDVGLPRGARRRTRGLRREEAAALSHMSTDYYARLERERGPQPSEQMLASIAQGLHLSRAERDHLFRLAGHVPSEHGLGGEHISPGLLRVLDRLDDTPADVVTELGETLRQSRLGVALTGDASLRRGPMRSLGYRWFADPASRSLYLPDDHAFLSRLFASGLREIVGRRGPGSRAAGLADDLLRRSEEFRELWARHEVGLRPADTKHFVHPTVGEIEVHCQTLIDPGTSHSLLVYTAAPGSESAEKLRLLAVVGPTVPA